MENEIIEVNFKQDTVIVTLRNGVVLHITSNPGSLFLHFSGIDKPVEINPARAANNLTINYKSRD